MAISITRYVDVVSGVGAGTVVQRRDLIGRLFTANNLLPPQSFIEFTNLADVGTYFGTTSEEYARASFYFGWISKNNTRAQKIQFARWVQTAVAPRIYGNVQTQILSSWTAITAGSFGLTIGADVNTFTGLNFSTATSLADVASILQTAIRTKTGTMWTASTVTYDATRGSFNFVGGNAITAIISVQQGVGGTPIAALLGWLSGNTLIIANGSAIETLTTTLDNSANASNNFGSFLFIPALAVDQIVEVATWNENQNFRYTYCVPVSSANASAYSTALFEIEGTGVVLSDTADQYPEQIPMMIEAATNYNDANAVQNYMFQQFPGIDASVTTDAVANVMDTLRINYYGQTQQAGQNISFFQRGVLMGGSDMNTYVNEIWLKDAATSAVMTLLLALSKVSANAKGRIQILTILQSVIDEALNNGTISVGKTLTPTQIMYITEITGDENAYYQIQTIGYWVDCVIESSGSPLVYKAVYKLVYAKDDDIRKVEGTHTLI